MEWFLNYRPDLARLVSHWDHPGRGKRRLLSLLRGPARRVAVPDVPIPYAHDLEYAVLPRGLRLPGAMQAFLLMRYRPTMMRWLHKRHGDVFSVRMPYSRLRRSAVPISSSTRASVVLDTCKSWSTRARRLTRAASAVKNPT